MSEAADVQLRYNPEVYSRVKDEEEMELNKSRFHADYNLVCTQLGLYGGA